MILGVTVCGRARNGNIAKERKLRKISHEDSR